MGKPVARGRLIAVGVVLVGVSASLLVVHVNALDSTSIDRAELDDGVLRVEGEVRYRTPPFGSHPRNRRQAAALIARKVPGPRFQLPVEQLPGDGH